MNKRFFLFLLTTSIITTTVFSQAPLAATNPNFEHDKMMGYYLQSQEVKLPDSIYTILKNYAFNKSLKEAAVLRNDYVFKVLFNKNLSTTDKLFACNFFIKANSDPYPYVPVFLLKSIQADLIELNKK